VRDTIDRQAGSEQEKGPDAMHDFGKDYWEAHWERPRVSTDASADAPADPYLEPNPHLVGEVGDLAPGTALDAGCGAGAEAVWLAARGWKVTAADISAEALAQAARHAKEVSAPGSVAWVEADLTSWEPGGLFDLVTTHYAHPAMPQLAFYRRVSEWVAPGGNLLIVGHLNHADGEGHGHGHQPPREATVTLADIAGVLNPESWRIETALERSRAITAPDGRAVPLHDAVVRAVRLP